MKHKEIKVSVLMSVYKESEEFLRSAIESIINQTYVNIQFVIILDNPNNILAEKIIQDYQKKDSRIIYCKNEVNLGLAGSLNKGLQLCTGKYIVRMDADDIAFLNRIEIQLQYAIDHNIDVLGGSWVNIDEKGIVISSVKNLPTSQKAVKRILKTTDCVGHPTWLVKSEVYTQLEGYREIHACEDYDFLLRALDKKYDIQNLKEPVLKYRINSQGISYNNLLQQYLTSTYLKECFQKNKIENIDGLENYLKKRLTEEAKDRYYNAMKIVDNALEHLNNTNIISLGTKLVKASIISRYCYASLLRILTYKIKVCWYGKN